MPGDPIGAHLRTFPPAQRAALQAVRETLRAALPAGVEGIAWGMPTIRIDGIGVACYEGFTNHNSFFPMSGTVTQRLAKDLERFTVTKGTIHFAVDTPFPARVIRRIVGVRIDDINESFPKKSGEMKHFYANGALESRGRMNGDVMVGAWEWFRRDGSIKRSGSFKAGVQIGEWTTYDSGGRVVKVIDFGRGR